MQTEKNEISNLMRIIEERCLEKVQIALELRPAPNGERLDMIESLMKIVGAIETINLNWACYNRRYETGSSRRDTHERKIKGSTHPEDLVIIDGAKNVSPERRKELLEMACVMFDEEFNET